MAPGAFPSQDCRGGLTTRMSSLSTGILTMTPLRQRFIEDLQLRNRSPKTIEVYVYHGREVARHFKQSTVSLFQFPVLMWPSQLCGLPPVDAQNSALSRSGTPHNPRLTDAKRPGVAGARVSGDDEPGRESRAADPSQFLGQPRIRWPSPRPLRGRRRRARQASVEHWNPIAYVALDQCPVRRNGPLLGPTPHN